jgi:hypothetical protein
MSARISTHIAGPGPLAHIQVPETKELSASGAAVTTGMDRVCEAAPPSIWRVATMRTLATSAPDVIVRPPPARSGCGGA